MHMAWMRVVTGKDEERLHIEFGFAIRFYKRHRRKIEFIRAVTVERYIAYLSATVL